ncbi:transposase [Nonomuraea sp. B10E15]|uniref:transposase n=1 Tax=Nonomuraea sp. B10E15 TaxID=3153560 RepID=UPI00325E9397
MTHPDRLDTEEKARLEQILARCPELINTAELVRSFATMMTNRDGHLLDDWIAAAEAGASPYLATFATSLRRDHAAVQAGLPLAHSSGAVEGTVNKIKFLKRQMFAAQTSTFYGPESSATPDTLHVLSPRSSRVSQSPFSHAAWHGLRSVNLAYVKEEIIVL